MTTTRTAQAETSIPYVDELRRVFRSHPDRHEAHEQARPVLVQMARDPSVLSRVFRARLTSPGAFDATHYPVVSFPVDCNPDFEMVANCWIPLPGRETDVTTKAVHHHGNLLLSTITAFGPGYEHWMFTRAEVVDPERELFSLSVVEAQPHPLHHVSFVDSYVPHVPLYPPSLTITLALWSTNKTTTRLDRLKRLPVVKRNQAVLRKLADRAGLRGMLNIQAPEYYDFYPTAEGFKGMKDREEFARGPNADYLYSLFHVIQETGNQGLGSVVRDRLESGPPPSDPALVRRLADDLEAGRPIEGRLSEGHYGVPFANFTRADMERGLAAQESRPARTAVN